MRSIQAILLAHSSGIRTFTNRLWRLSLLLLLSLSGAAIAGLTPIPGADSDFDGAPDAIELIEGTNPAVKDNDVFNNTRLFVRQAYRDFVGREGELAGINFWVAEIDAGRVTRAQLILRFLQSAEFQSVVAPVVRLYFAAFGRLPDQAGLAYWATEFKNGRSLESISEAFSAAPELTNLYGPLTNRQYVERLYLNVLGRPGELSGITFWTGQLDTNAKTRGQVLAAFAESAEFVASSQSRVFVTMTYVGLLSRIPEIDGYNFWVAQFDGGRSPLDLIQAFLDSAEYRSRFVVTGALVAPRISSPAVADFFVGTSSTFTIQAGGNPSVTSVTLSGCTLPTGLNFNPSFSSATISGTPTAAGSAMCTVTATNGVDPAATQSLLVRVNSAPVAPTITSASTANFVVGTAGSFSVTTSGVPAVNDITITGCPLPGGLSFFKPSGSTTLFVQGTPTTPGTTTCTVTASNGVNPSATQTLQVNITAAGAAPAITSPNTVTFTVGTASSFTVTATGSPSPTLSATGAFPAGVSFNPATRALAGTPAAGTGGTYPIQFTAANGNAPDAIQTFALRVNQAPAITSATSFTTAVGGSGTFTVTATGFPAPTLALSGCTLPSGMNFNAATGLLSGAPAAATGGQRNCTITASNGVGANATQAFTLTVNQPPAITSPAIWNLSTGTAGSLSLSATGFPAPTFALASCPVPSVTLTGNVLNATPALGTGAGYPCNVIATNGVSPNATQTISVNVSESANIAITSAATANFIAGTGSTFNITTTALPAVTGITLTGCALPAGLTYANTAGTATIFGNASATGNTSCTLTASNGIVTATQSLTVSVRQVPTISAPVAGTTYDVGTSSATTFNVAGFPAPTLSISGCTLPAGLTVNGAAVSGNGVTGISGNPTGPGGVTNGCIVTASNSAGSAATAAFSLTVNQTPVAVGDSYSIAHDTSLVVPAATGVRSNDVGFPLPTVAQVTGPTNGLLTLNADGSFNYTPSPNFAGIDSFTYRIGTSNVATVTITVTNALPVVDLSGAATAGIDFTAAFTEAAGAVAIVDAANLTVTDTDSTQLASATAGITNLLNGAAESLSVTCSAVAPGCEGAIQLADVAYTAATGTLTITRVAPLADYRTLLRTLRYNNSSVNPTTTSRIVNITVNDQIANNNPLAIATVTVAAVNNAPTVTAPAGGSVAAGATLTFSTANSNAISVADVDAGTSTLTITLTGTNGAVNLNGTVGLTGVTGQGTGLVSATGTLTDLNTALNGVTYTTVAGFAGGSLQVQVNDNGNTGSGGPLTASRTVTIIAGQPPVLANGGNSVTFTEPSPAVVVNGGITVTDGDSAGLASATVTISANFAAGQDVLAFTNAAGMGNISGVYAAPTLTLTSAGASATPAQWTAALRSVSYNNTSLNPTTTARTITFQVNDGGLNSNTVTTTVNVIAVNNQPTATNPGTLAMRTSIPITFPAGTLGGTDVESGTTITIDTTPQAGSVPTGASVTINANGSFTFVPPAGATGTIVGFAYRVSDNGNPGPGLNSAYQNVSFNITGPNILYVKTAAAGTGNCTLANECTLATALVGGSNNKKIFISDSGTHTGSVTLGTATELYGQGLIATDFDTAFGITVPVAGTIPARPLVSQARPTLTSSGATLTVGIGNFLQGFDVASTGGVALTGTNFGNLNVNQVAITAGQPALSLVNNAGTVSVTLSSLTSTGGAIGVNLVNLNGSVNIASTTSSITGATGTGISITGGGTANITYSGSVTAAAGTRSVRVDAKTGGTVTLGRITDSGLGISLTNNTGATIQFAGMLLNTGANTAFSATGGGTVIATQTPNSPSNPVSNIISTTTGTAINVANTLIGASGLSFVSVSSNGAANAIVLNATGTAGGLSVTGNGGACTSVATCTGGAIQNTTGDAISLTNTANPSFATVFIGNPGNHGVNANGVSGTATFNNSVITGFAAVNANGYNLRTSPNINLTVNGSTFSNSATGNAGISAEWGGAGNNATVTIGGSTFTGLFGDAVQATTLTGVTGAVNVNVRTSTFQTAAANGNNGIYFAPFGGAVTFNFDVDGNTFNDIMRPVTNLGAINFTAGATAAPGPIVTGQIRNNMLSSIVGSRGIAAIADTFAGAIDFTVNNNTINGLGSTSKHAINVGIRDNVANAKVRVTNNPIGQTGNLWAFGNGTAEAILVQTQNAASADVLLDGNTVTANASLEVMRVRAINTSTLNATVRNNNLNDTNTTHIEFAAVTGSGAVAGGTICLNMSSNTLPAAGVGVINIAQNAAPGLVRVTQASSAAVATANSGATVNVTGAPTFGAAACTLP